MPTVLFQHTEFLQIPTVELKPLSFSLQSNILQYQLEMLQPTDVPMQPALECLIFARHIYTQWEKQSAGCNVNFKQRVTVNRYFTHTVRLYCLAVMHDYASSDCGLEQECSSHHIFHLNAFGCRFQWLTTTSWCEGHPTYNISVNKWTCTTCNFATIRTFSILVADCWIFMSSRRHT